MTEPHEDLSKRDDVVPSLSFVIPAYNEERLLGRTLDVLVRSARAIGQPFEIIVADDGSTDRTAEIAREHGVRVVTVEHRQIAATRNSGARAASGETLFFVDADTVVDAEVIRAALSALASGAVGGGCRVRFDGRLPLYGRILERVGSAVQRLVPFAAGCFVFCRRKAFDDVGGFDERLFGGEEIELSRVLKRKGRFVVLRSCVETSGRKLRTYSGWTILRTLANLLVRGRRGVRRRDGLDIWYGPRLDDPESPGP